MDHLLYPSDNTHIYHRLSSMLDLHFQTIWFLLPIHLPIQILMISFQMKSNRNNGVSRISLWIVISWKFLIIKQYRLHRRIQSIVVAMKYMGNHDLMELRFYQDKDFLTWVSLVRMCIDLFQTSLKICYFFLILLTGPIY